MRIHIVRHTAVGVNGVCYGQTDVPLKDTFEQEAEIVKQKLKDIPCDVVFSSPLSRAKKLAEYCGYSDIQLYDRLKELHFGDWEMKEWDKIDMSEWEKDWINNPAPNGESFQQMYERVASFLDEIKKENYSSVVVFAHGGVINCFKVYFGETDLKGAFDKLAGYGEILKFEL
ncbi:alpha-ribazole phosphatase [Dysgonomonas sp. Marseille-P4677]|uniref:alpha-ribazole phosphatase n=1 Tax=Dysgonomonas sp. Marseille-P4677 TaxID=2364790 RepID=UPI001913FCD8|nr:alpha-ribazole phosphatase [Dysgonomonas sp. Marseille-P4677]MBK5722404.1 alpha-ribazole phosphatase [Dysgonomonas sp. Marseille-P4677]